MLSRRKDTNLSLVGEMRVDEMRVGKMRRPQCIAYPFHIVLAKSLHFGLVFRF